MEIQNKTLLETVRKKFKNSVKTPELYLRQQDDKVETHKNLVKSLYKYVEDFTPSIELILTDMDEEQIWQQLELQNDSVIAQCLKQTANLLAKKNEFFNLPYNFQETNEVDVNVGGSHNADDDDNDEDEDKDCSDVEDSEEIASSNDESMEENEEELEHEVEDEKDEDDDEDNIFKESKKEQKTYKKSIVDDEFFKLDEMNEFLDNEDQKEFVSKGKTKKPFDEIDYFNDISDDDDDDDDEDVDDDNDSAKDSTKHKKTITGKNAKFSDFFAPNPPSTSMGDRQNVKLSRELKNKRKQKQKLEDLGLDSEPEIDDQTTSNHPLSIDKEFEIHQKKREDFLKSIQNKNDDKSSFEQRQDRLNERINTFQEAALADKSWQLKGEISAANRPQDSLLQEILEYDTVTRPIPIITEKTTMQLEDIIKQRIKDKSWDDVERKFKPIQTPQEYRKKLVLDQEKSKQSLAQIYENEYLKQLEATTVGGDAGDKRTQSDYSTGGTTFAEDEEPKEHKEIRQLMKTLFVKLDALSNFYYTPKPIMPEVRIITNIPAIDIEEVAPVATSDATLLAPEEIKSRPKGNVIGRSERTVTDKKRERRQKKIKQKLHNKHLEKKIAERQKLGLKISDKDAKNKLLNKVTKNRNIDKMTVSNDGKTIKSSKMFFNQLQDSVMISNNDSKKRKVTKVKENKQLSAKKFKL